MAFNPTLAATTIEIYDYATATDIINVIPYRAIRNVTVFHEDTKDNSVQPPTVISTQRYVRIHLLDDINSMEVIPLGYGTSPLWPNNAAGEQTALIAISNAIL